MTAAQAAAPIYCDGCTRLATQDHLRSRVVRLELASRFRPIHIGTLFLIPAPPAAMEDFFYFPAGEPGDADTRALYDDVLQSCGITQGTGTRESVLRQFQEAGYFLTECVECPTNLLGGEEYDALLDRLLPTLERRIRFSYRPKSILLISERLTRVGQALRVAGLGSSLLMREGKPVSLPKSADWAGRERFQAEVRSLLR